ncbi:TonB-dependent siderophore receptor [Acetobacter syzygii]|uniref:TonB-dependent siderophore receptor n=1 Tax=Acetobacter syzygii TaxID=146476 RepID=UPI0039E94BA2
MSHVLPTGRRLGISMMLALGTSLSALGGSPAFAQQGQAAIPSIHLDIPRQPLSAALQAFSRRTGIQVVYTASIDAGIISPGISGDFDAMSALSRLLSGTGVTFRQSGKGAVVLAKASANITLGPVRVGGTTAHQDPTGPGVGYVATNTMSATKTDTPITEIPNSIYVVTQQQMIDQGAQTVMDALKYTGGIYAGASGTFNNGNAAADSISFYQRGFSTHQFVDGLLSNSQSAGETAFLERIEAINGPASVMYGQTTPGGMLAMSLKKPTDTPLHQVSVGFGNWGRYESTVDFSDKLTKSGNLRYRVAAIGVTQGTQTDHVDYHRVGVLPSITWDIDHKTSLTLLGMYMYTPGTGISESNDYPLKGSLITDGYRRIPRNNFLGTTNWNTEADTTAMFEYQFQHNFNKYINFSQTFRYEQSSANSKNSYYDGSVDSEEIYQAPQWAKETFKTTALDSRVYGKFQTGSLQHTWVVGSDFRSYHYNWYYQRDKTTGGDFIVNMYNPGASYTPCFSTSVSAACKGSFGTSRYDYFQEGVYFQDQIKWKRLSILLGGRQDWVNYNGHASVYTYDNTNGQSSGDTTPSNSAPQPANAFTWRAGILYNFKFGLTPYFSYATSFVPQTSTNYQGQPFAPLTGKQLEAGLKYKVPNKDILLTAAAFRIDEDHYLEQDPIHTSYSLDAGRVRSQGFEVSANANITRDLRLIASYSYVDIRYAKTNKTASRYNPYTETSYGDKISERGMFVPYVPRNMFSAFVDYSLPNNVIKGFGLNGGIRYVGFTYTDSVESYKAPAYFLFDIGAHYDFGASIPSLKGLKAQLAISNLTNKYYVTRCSNYDCYIGQGRRVYGNLTYNW